MPDFKMPAMKVGDGVYWKQYPDQDPLAAVVTAVGRTSLSLSVFYPGVHNLHVVDGVPHQEDPRIKQRLDSEDGCWLTVEEGVNEAEAAASAARSAAAKARAEAAKAKAEATKAAEAKEAATAKK